MNIYKLALSVLLIGSSVVFSSCNNEEDDIFDGSAAQRLDEYKKQYMADLTSDGGRWLMEYFSNEEEEGYVFVMTFGKDGSVKVSGQNKWTNYMYVTDTSLWGVIADDGPVLTFNTYNKVFHLFSTPENIEGPYAPTNPDANPEDNDIDETGTGHGGDYEFVVVSVSEDGKTMHLTGKKTLHDIYLKRLDNDVDELELLASYSYASMNTMSNVFPDLILTDTNTDELFVVSGCGDGVFDFWPKDGDAVVQTVTMNGLVGPESIRLRKPLAIERSNGVDSIVVENFIRQENGTFLCMDNGQNLVLDCIGLGNIFAMDKYSWNIGVNAGHGKFAELLNNISTEAKAKMRITFRGFDIGYNNAAKKYALNFKRNGSAALNLLYGDEIVTNDGEAVKFKISTSEGNENGLLIVDRIPSIIDFVNYLNECDFQLEPSSRFAPMTVTFINKSNPEDRLTLNYQAK